MTEILELEGLINLDIFQLLDASRKARNNWAHNLKAPSTEDACTSLSAGETLVNDLLGVRLHFQSGGRGGVPWKFVVDG